MTKFNVVLAVVAVALGVASAVTDEEKKAVLEALKPVLDDCRDKFGITREMANSAKEAKDISALDSCFYACCFQKMGFISEDGLFDADAAMETNKKYLKGEEDLKALAQMSETCTAVNEQSVTDGAKGCERSKLLLECFLKEKANISYFNY